MISPDDDLWKICATCRHLQVLSQGREIPELIDSEYIEYYCPKTRSSTREDYLLTPMPEELEDETPHVCPHWEAVPQEDDDILELD